MKVYSLGYLIDLSLGAEDEHAQNAQRLQVIFADQFVDVRLRAVWK